jgi:hypothetical protein
MKRRSNKFWIIISNSIATSTVGSILLFLLSRKVLKQIRELERRFPANEKVAKTEVTDMHASLSGLKSFTTTVAAYIQYEVGHVAPAACNVQERLTVRYSVDIGAVFDELFCKDELVFMGRIFARMCPTGQILERHLTSLQLFSKQHVEIDALEPHEKWTVCWSRKHLLV